MKRAKLQPVDYLVLFGGPLAFMLIAFFGLRAVVGHPPRPNPVDLLHKGAVSVGQSTSQIEDALGKPTSVESQPDGSFIYRYIRSTFSTQEGIAQDDGIVEFTESGRVMNIRFDHSRPPEPVKSDH